MNFFQVMPSCWLIADRETLVIRTRGLLLSQQRVSKGTHGKKTKDRPQSFR